MENGEEKKKWYRVGHLKETNKGGRFLTLYHMPEADFYVFEDDEDSRQE